VCSTRQFHEVGFCDIKTFALACHLARFCLLPLDLIRLGEWWPGTPRPKTRCSPFAALRVAAA
jgi:hypothetical protein